MRTYTLKIKLLLSFWELWEPAKDEDMLMYSKWLF